MIAGHLNLLLFGGDLKLGGKGISPLPPLKALKKKKKKKNAQSAQICNSAALPLVMSSAVVYILYKTLA